tara:strand:- start:2 stop:148 length:147 start_codon:yes stop_codon:yes gene_type:complete
MVMTTKLNMKEKEMASNVLAHILWNESKGMSEEQLRALMKGILFLRTK